MREAHFIVPIDQEKVGGYSVGVNPYSASLNNQ